MRCSVKAFAKKHPELLAAFMQTPALDFAAGIIARTIQDGMSEISHAITEQDFVSTALNKIAEAIDDVEQLK